KFQLLLFSILSPFLIFAQEVQEIGLDEKIDQAFGSATGWFVQGIFYSIPITEDVGVLWVLIPLILGATFFTIYFMFPGIRFFGTAIRTVKGDFEQVEELPSDLNVVDGDNPDTIRVEGSEGEVSHFQALTAALSATVGLGNIAGVAVAVVIGGAGATFWMILAGLIGMSSKFVECTLGVKYREVDENGKVYGGPMYYLSKGLGERNFKFAGKFLAAAFAVMCIGGSFGGGNMFQANQAASIFMNSFNIESSNGGFIFGIFLSIIVGVVILGGIKRIATVTEKIVPFMAVVYVGAALIIILMNIGLVPLAIKSIISDAFAPTAIAGGFVGVLVQGFKRAAFSNEAGIGSAAIAHSAVKTNYAASEGIVALLEPFIDTVVICTMTALVIVISSLKGEFALGSADGNAVLSSTGEVLTGVDLTSFVFSSSIPMFNYVLTIAVILFAFSSMISWSYYGLQSWTYLFGKGKINENIYKILFCLFVVIGAAANMGNVLDFSDAMIFAMMVPNMIGLFILVPVVKKELDKYLAAIKNK
ncbi:MAG: alanine/glycine:cation symporter family protein, partial [Chitinophagales bacterium]